MENGIIVIGICDDNEGYLGSIEKVLLKYQGGNDIRCKNMFYRDPVDFLAQPPEVWDIVLLDIEMPGMDGFEVAKRLSSRKCRAKIIFMTNHREWWETGFDLKAYHYLVKPCPYEKLAKVLDKAMNEILRYESVLLYKLNGTEIYHVYVEDIYHIQTLKNNTKVHTEDLELYSLKNLSWWVTTYPDRYFQCHRAHLVNLDHIHILQEGGKLVMKNGLKVPVAERKYYKLRKAMHSHIKTKSKYLGD